MCYTYKAQYSKKNCDYCKNKPKKRQTLPRESLSCKYVRPGNYLSLLGIPLTLVSSIGIWYWMLG
jgi:hypothetical protein